jgi:ankyrin repeat protein
MIDALNNHASHQLILALIKRPDFFIDFQYHRSRNTPLLAAIEVEREDVTVELILRGANLELDSYGLTPMTQACAKNLRRTAFALFQGKVSH